MKNCSKIRNARKTFRISYVLCGDGTKSIRNEFKIFSNTTTISFGTCQDWLEFMRTNVSFSYGTRFHVNMAALLAGRPAMWITHDTRTQELVEYFKLPHMNLKHASVRIPHDIGNAIDLTPFFDNYDTVSKRFNEFLEIAGLPKLVFQT